MKYYSLLLLCWLYSISAQAQEPLWLRQIGNSGQQSVRDLFRHAQGQVYVSGTNDPAAGPLVLNPATGLSLQETSGFIVKYNPQGQALYAQRIRVQNQQTQVFGNFVSDLKIQGDGQGNIIASGWIGSGNERIDPGDGVFRRPLDGTTSMYGFVIKYTDTGTAFQMQWITLISPGSAGFQLNESAIDATGNVYISTAFFGVESSIPLPRYLRIYRFAPTVPGATLSPSCSIGPWSGDLKCYIRLNSDGHCQWTHVVPGSGLFSDRFAVASDQFYIFNDREIRRLSTATGTSIGTPYVVSAQMILGQVTNSLLPVNTSAGPRLFVGYSTPGANNNAPERRIQKLIIDASGQITGLDNQFGMNNDGESRLSSNITPTHFQYVPGQEWLYVTGTFTGTAQFGSGWQLTAAQTGTSYFVARYSATTGACQWTYQVGSTGIPIPVNTTTGRPTVRIAASGNEFYLAGDFAQTLQMNTCGNNGQLTSLGNIDIFLSKHGSLDVGPLAISQWPVRICSNQLTPVQVSVGAVSGTPLLSCTWTSSAHFGSLVPQGPGNTALHAQYVPGQGNANEVPWIEANFCGGRFRWDLPLSRPYDMTPVTHTVAPVSGGTVVGCPGQYVITVQAPPLPPNSDLGPLRYNTVTASNVTLNSINGNQITVTLGPVPPNAMPGSIIGWIEYQVSNVCGSNGVKRVNFVMPSSNLSFEFIRECPRCPVFTCANFQIRILNNGVPVGQAVNAISQTPSLTVVSVSGDVLTIQANNVGATSPEEAFGPIGDIFVQVPGTCLAGFVTIENTCVLVDQCPDPNLPGDDPQPTCCPIIDPVTGLWVLPPCGDGFLPVPNPSLIEVGMDIKVASTALQTQQTDVPYTVQLRDQQNGNIVRNLTTQNGYTIINTNGLLPGNYVLVIQFKNRQIIRQIQIQ